MLGRFGASWREKCWKPAPNLGQYDSNSGSLQEKSMLRTIHCGDLTREREGQDVTLGGWVHARRDHGGLIFIDIRDRSGIVQVVFNPELAPDSHAASERFRSEWVVQVSGTVRLRPEGTLNPGLATGEIEVIASDAVVLNESKTPPFEIGDDLDVDELLRMKFRYLDLRRPRMQQTMTLRHKVVKYIRDFLDDRGFLEIETPILIKSTPEGARDYLVPSRLYPGQFYALPQSPQQLKPAADGRGHGQVLPDSPLLP